MRLPDDLDTPALVVDAGRMEKNLARMADAAAAGAIALRPHAKTHKCVQIARRQLAYHAAGLTVATLAEAELFAGAGCGRLFIAYPLWAGGGRRPRLAALHERAELRAGVDSLAAAGELAAAVSGTGRPLQVLIEIDSGQHRTGVAPRDAAALAAGCLRLGLDVIGAFTHPGHAYLNPDGVAAAAADERSALATVGEALEGLLGRAPVLSGGSTPTAYDGMARPLTEARPGTYVFGDRQQMHLSGITEGDVALVVAARVVSVPRPGEAVLDSGSKALSSDRPPWLTGHGRVLEAPEATVDVLSEEHAVVHGLRSRLAVGELVRVIPNHVCTVVNLAHELVVVGDGTVADRWPVVTRRSSSSSAPQSISS
ncbi:MAG: alanine racemase [Streptosporangiaceae bacterium]|nr:alanine racemase [Streptosporangiaceae bacterium]MBV9853212.1 alanine racemase [Streptosporangiaceae bacterium]